MVWNHTQGSILGPLLFNVFINDIFYTIENVYNYADDNVLSCSGDSLQEVATSLESSTLTALKWFENNSMKANPSKFQAIVFGLKAKADDICFNINENKVEATKCVKQLGVYIDENLTFDEHISHICMKAARQLNSLQRIAKYLSQRTKNVVFNSFIMSNFSYCSLVWHICSVKNTKKWRKFKKGASVLYGMITNLTIKLFWKFQAGNWCIFLDWKSLHVLSINVWTIPVLV